MPRFVSQRANPIDLIVSESQLQRFLSQEWREKSKRIAGENGLTIEHSTRYWHFNFMRQGRRYHKTLGRYLEKWTLNGMAVDENRKTEFSSYPLAWVLSDFGFFNAETYGKVIIHTSRFYRLFH